MTGLAKLYARNEKIRELALVVTKNLKDRDYRAEAAALWHLVRSRVRFVRDIAGLETVQTPIVTLQQGGGDCDDLATLIAALAGSISHGPLFFKTVDVGIPPGWSHVYLVDVIDGQPYPLDASDSRFPPGTELDPSRVKRSKLWRI